MPANYRTAAREMIARAKEDPSTSRHYGANVRAQRAIFIECAGLYFDSYYRSLWRECYDGGQWTGANKFWSYSSIARAVFCSAVSREIIHCISPNRRLP